MFERQTCPRCKDKLRIERDEYGWYSECIMCGYMYDLIHVVLKQRINAKSSNTSTEQPSLIK